MKRIKKAISVFVVTALLLAMLPTCMLVVKADIKRDDAISWLYNQVNRTGNCDVDGNGLWCTDLATAYINYCWLRTNNDNRDPWGIYPYTTTMAYAYDDMLRGNENWMIITRTSSTVPQPGDLFVSEQDSMNYGYGHVGVILEVLGSNKAKIIQMSENKKPYISNVTWGSTASYNPQYFIRFNHFILPSVPVAPKIAISSTEYAYDQDITISWDAVSGASAYSYYLSEFPEGYAYTTNTKTGSVNTNYITFSANELKDGKYTLFIHAYNSVGNSTQSNSVSFSIYAKEYLPVKTDEYNGHVYALYDYEMSWSFARDLCVKMGGHLVTICDQSEERFVENLIKSGEKDAYWLGATNYVSTSPEVWSDYKWVTDEVFAYTNWDSGEPSFSGEKGTREHFLELRKSYGYKWNDVNNINKGNKGFVLEMELASKKGDADGDGEITVSDALSALRVAAKLAEATQEMVSICDTDGDGQITVADALAILRVAAKLADSL